MKTRPYRGWAIISKRGYILGWTISGCRKESIRRLFEGVRGEFDLKKVWARRRRDGLRAEKVVVEVKPNGK